jgi:hypothetical protein
MPTNKKLHCCEMMRRSIDSKCNQHKNIEDCPDNIIRFVSKFNEYGIAIRDRGSAISLIKYCPWCGKRLPNSMRNKWFDELQEMGLDPWKDKIPTKYQTAKWYSKK